MSQIMTTSQWIGFFTKAGLPANVSANYALIFSENRIQLDMLLDLSKEYLYDMGIKVMGDVIGILKYAKEFHNQLAKQRLIGERPSSASNSAVANRMVGRLTRKATPVHLHQPAPVHTPPNYHRNMQTAKPKVISLKRGASPVTRQMKAMKIRRVPPEEEGAYRIKMPSGTTERTRKILQQQAAAKRSVFARLGDSAVSSSTDTDKPISSSVFERLGASGKNSDDIPTSTVTVNVNKPSKSVPPLPYRGVLKMTIGKNRTVVSNSPVKNPVITRLVPKPSQRPNATTAIRISHINNLLQHNQPNSAQLVQARLANRMGVQVASKKPISQRLGIQGRLGNKISPQSALGPKVSVTGAVTQGNVFSRLGK